MKLNIILLFSYKIQILQIFETSKKINLNLNFTTTVLATHSGDIAPLLWIQSLIVCAFRHILPLRAPLRAFFAFVIS